MLDLNKIRDDVKKDAEGWAASTIVALVDEDLAQRSHIAMLEIKLIHAERERAQAVAEGAAIANAAQQYIDTWNADLDADNPMGITEAEQALQAALDAAPLAAEHLAQDAAKDKWLRYEAQHTRFCPIYMIGLESAGCSCGLNAILAPPQARAEGQEREGEHHG